MALSSDVTLAEMALMSVRTCEIVRLAGVAKTMVATESKNTKKVVIWTIVEGTLRFMRR